MCYGDSSPNTAAETDIISALQAEPFGDLLSSPEFHAFEQELDAIFTGLGDEQRTLLSLAAAGLRSHAIQLLDRMNNQTNGKLESVGTPLHAAELVIRACETAIRHANYHVSRTGTVATGRIN